VSERTGLGVVEVSVLEALDELGARPERPYVKCARVVQLLADEHGVSPRYGYDALCALARPWLVHLRLVDFHGNFGSADEGDRPANPRYTEARLSTAGALALAAERRTGPRLPIGLVNGDLHVDGSSPAFSPSRVIDTILALLDDPELPDLELVERIGPPAFPTGCRVECDHAALAAALPTTLMLTARLTVEAGRRGPAIVVSNLPPGVGPQQISDAIAARAEGHFGRLRERSPERFAALTLPLRDVRDESDGSVTRIVCELRTGADVAECERKLASTWGVTIRRPVQLRAPLPRLLRDLVDAGAAQRSALTALLATI
jgi:DNA gyrase subunit A